MKEEIKAAIWDKIPGEVIFNGKAPARIGTDLHRDSDFAPVIKDRKGWEALGRRMEKRANTGVFKWKAFVTWIPARKYYSIDLGGKR